jgi:hypothetical protein
VRLQEAADRALEQARLKFASAEVGQDTDNAALVFAHQSVLQQVGIPQTMGEVRAYERWRTVLGELIEAGAKAHQGA